MTGRAGRPRLLGKRLGWECLVIRVVVWWNGRPVLGDPALHSVWKEEEELVWVCEVTPGGSACASCVL